MKTGQQLLNERISRIKTAVALGKPDRTPIVFNGSAFVARSSGIKLSGFMENPLETLLAVHENMQELGDIDSQEVPVLYPPVLGPFWLSKMKLPGRELRDDELWQIDEVGLMTEEDYDFIIDKGWNAFFADYCTNRLDNGLRHFAKIEEIAYPITMDLVSRGIVPFASAISSTPNEIFCGGRTIVNFSKDMYRIPDKLEAAMDAAMPDTISDLKHMIEVAHPFAVFLGGARAASSFMNPKHWERFFFKYLRQLVDVIVDAGVVAYLHFDGDWNRDLPRLLELPKGKCVLSLDGSTDIFRAKEILGDHMCLMGDIPPAMFTLGTPDEVYNYSTRLIKEVGPSGFILSQGCMVPPNARVENVKAMIAAATGK